MEGERKVRLEHAMRTTQGYYPIPSPSPCSQRVNRRSGPIGILIVLLVCSPGLTFAQSDKATSQSSIETPAPQARQYLFGDWGGERTALADRGVTFKFHYITDLQANPVGGLEQTQAGWGRIRGTIDIDFGKLTDWNGLTFHATGLWQFGGNLGEKIGVLANPSGLVSAHATRLDSWWLQQAILHSRLFIKAGQFAGLDFYGNQEYGGSYLIEPLDYALGNLFPTTYESFNPAGTPAAEIRFFLWRQLYVKSAVLSGNRNPYEQDPTGFHFAIRDSPDFVFETGYTHDAEFLNTPSGAPGKKIYPGIFKFGAAYNGGKFTDANGIRSSGNYLIYGMAYQAVYRPDAGSNRGLDTTFSFDWSPNDVNQENSQITLGARYNGPIPARSQDGVAFGFVYTHIGDPFQSLGVPGGMPLLGSEKAIELNYAAYVRSYFLLQPVFQYYVDVGGNSRIPNAAVFGFRTKVTF
jgi:porin